MDKFVDRTDGIIKKENKTIQLQFKNASTK